MPAHAGFSAWLTIDGVKTPEFSVRTAEQTVSCWIAAEVGKNFSVHWANVSVPGMTGGRVLVDGNNCDGQILAREKRPTSTSMAGFNETTTSVRPFVFAPLELTDDDAALEAVPDERIGTIDVEIWKVRSDGFGASVWAGLPAPPPLKRTHERAKTAANQQIAFCDPVYRQPAEVAGCKWTQKIVTFSFKYRSLDLLRANGIAPPLRDKGKRKASPECLVSGDSEADSDAEEARLLETRLSEIRAKQAQKNLRKRRLKAEDEGTVIDLTPRPRKRIKLEDSDKKPLFCPKDLIDLTQPAKSVKLEERTPFFSSMGDSEIIDLTSSQ
ncbi:hypothetical protein B0H15DRAFT_182093 [Mycena belliarum]|uniref:DUF7918 domain-containing protein n=1 Tax=Mycena belliarum TaxID=1033014 RepID=A0AAD6U8I9_9AGAR|nr:hypothetical protein B0H15DRAFT_182093 [Mycena belliae]